MTIHTLHDLCYAYSVADPVREMLFALQDRIDALEAQRKPLSDEMVHGRIMWRCLTCHELKNRVGFTKGKQ